MEPTIYEAALAASTNVSHFQGWINDMWPWFIFAWFWHIFAWQIKGPMRMLGSKVGWQ